MTLLVKWEVINADPFDNFPVLVLIFYLRNTAYVAKKCNATEGFVEEATSIISYTEKRTLIRDTGLILAA